MNEKQIALNTSQQILESTFRWLVAPIAKALLLAKAEEAERISKLFGNMVLLKLEFTNRAEELRKLADEL